MAGVARQIDKFQHRPVGIVKIGARAIEYAALPLLLEGDFERALPEIMGKPGPVFTACKVVPEIENEPIARRRRWQTRTRDEVVVDLRRALGAA